MWPQIVENILINFVERKYWFWFVFQLIRDGGVNKDHVESLYFFLDCTVINDIQ